MNTERQKNILELVFENKSISVKALTERLFASESSIRRDLAYLEEQKLIKRTHGGAEIVNSPSSTDKIPFLIREYEQGNAKKNIAEKAIKKVHDNYVIFLDSSSSVYMLIPYFETKKNLTVITNSAKALIALAEHKIRAISTGGVMLGESYAFVGDAAVQTISSINADIAFFSCRGISADGYLTDMSMEENIIRQKMIQQSRYSYALCAKEKFNKKYYHNLCHTNDITGIISENDG